MTAVLGGKMYSAGGPIKVTILRPTADVWYISELWLFSPGPPRYLGLNFDVGRVTVLDPIPAGTELIFGIYVHDNGYTFYMGPGSRNPDGREHAIVSQDGGTAIVGFEDLFGNVQFTYYDNTFLFEGIAGGGWAVGRCGS